MSGLIKSGVMKSGLLAALVLMLSGCIHNLDIQTSEHAHSHDHDDGSHHHSHSHGDDHRHSHALHHGMVLPLFSAKQHVGYAELKLHDDKGDLELWVTEDKAGQHPIDLPLDAEISVSFPELAYKTVTLKVRNTERNEDEDGKGNIRTNMTNYFIFPGDTGADATFLMGKEFASDTVIYFETEGTKYWTGTFKLRPHTH